ncbi:(E)-4-hydroxy-3-methylbut-2-enyl-diphosphate synthase [Opitutus terrae]|uniref:4-hydroxy-3-methylbut-2-en-1-yl diphosphate synthase (flavodoxin) n=1 Tax=Opitutus terrae (strain DSM 11246 / JCM 15787 / PB90-1) TaxID=452637 RepID=B2A0F0_OPITP|nr:(E)-4-hydroxy-3-methylbut-2-enyl-diphosphate synthase [Opitutus terrae]ACB77904.1 1-hydroxy-2-methyl-2-(E)-butenyl 4-diphosphate synthase [Opitutus terrae PB90-1]
MSYCSSRFHTVRRRSLEVKVGSVGVGGDNPIRIQSMTTSDTQDVAATVAQAIALAEVGCEIVRVTAPNIAAAQCLKEIRERFTAAGFGAVPLVADIHFLPAAAMEAIEHVEKVRVNPGNYADKKKFAVREYTDTDYERELQRLHETFSPLVLRAKALGRSLRIGTNHGSLSDRIMNRYGDTPLGMVESALEFLRIAESHGFDQLILSMKASNPKVMIQAYRLLVERMQQEAMHYPLHLGVTEAGDGEDGRIKSAIGIGSLLLDGLGDTIRVSLTEDSVYEIPVAQVLAAKAMSLWQPVNSECLTPDSAFLGANSIDPFHFTRRVTASIRFADKIAVGPELPPVVLTRVAAGDLAVLRSAVTNRRLADTPAEGLIVSIDAPAGLATLPAPGHAFYALELAPAVSAAAVAAQAVQLPAGTLIVHAFSTEAATELAAFAELVRERPLILAADIAPGNIPALAPILRTVPEDRLLFTLSSQLSAPGSSTHAVGSYRQLSEALRHAGLRAPIWIRNTARSAIRDEPSFLSKLLEASILTGALLCDGIGDLVSLETEADPVRATKLAYNVLQGAGARTSKTEFVACPSCGRTLFDLQTTTQRIRAQTGHLKGVKLAIMGCIVNGPGEMADADFGYVGGAPGKINLYVGKQCVAYNIPQAEADARLIALIKEHGKWVDPQPAAV